MLRLALPCLASFLAAAPLLARQQPDSGYFVIRLGTDTTGIERYVWEADRLVITSVRRSPRTEVREVTVLFGPDGVVQRAELVSRDAGAAPGTAGTRIVITFGADSATIETTRPDGTTSTRRAAFGREELPLRLGVYAPYDVMLHEVLGSKGELTAARSFWGGTGESPLRIERLGRDSAVLHDPVLGEMRARVDRRNHLVALTTGGGFGTSVERVRSLDLEALTREFAARDAAGRGLGFLSPRDTVLATVHGAELKLDYGRPSKRGRPIFGGLVPWNRVWRLGANRATHLWTGRDLIMDGTLVPAGTYTLYLLPSHSGWRLIINRQTGQEGTEYDSAQDLARIRLRTTTLPQPVEQLTLAIEEQGDGGVIHIRWDRTQASAPFTLAPLTAVRRTLEEVGRAHGGRRRIEEVSTLLLRGSGVSHWLGQNPTPVADLPAAPIQEYRRAIDFANRRWRAEQVVVLDSVVRGFGTQRQVSGWDDGIAFNVFPNGHAVRAPADAAIVRAFELLHHPLGALRAAWAPGADLALEPGRPNRIRVTRDGRTLSLAFDPTTRLITAVATPAYHAMLGDVTLETLFEDYRDVQGLRLPGRIVTRLDGVTITEIQLDSIAVDAAVGDLAAPAAVRDAPPPESGITVAAEELAPGVWHLTGGSHHSVLIEFADHLMLVEAPQGDARTLAVIARARELRPDKPLRYVVNTHHHFDHAGGIRAAVAEGLTVITHEGNRAFIEDIVRRPHTFMQDALARNPRPLAIETLANRRTLRDATRTVELYAVRGRHSGTMLVAYLPRERLLIQADLFNPPPPGAPSWAAPFADELLQLVRTRGLGVERIVPIHGSVVPFAELEAVATRAN